MNEPKVVKSLWETKCEKLANDVDEVEKICDRIAIGGILFFIGAVSFVVQELLKHKRKPKP